MFATISETKRGPSGFPLDTEPSSSLRRHPSGSQRAPLSPAPLTPSVHSSPPLLISSSVKLREPVCRFRPGFQTPNSREGRSQPTIPCPLRCVWVAPAWLAKLGTVVHQISAPLKTSAWLITWLFLSAEVSFFSWKQWGVNVLSKQMSSLFTFTKRSPIPPPFYDCFYSLIYESPGATLGEY